MALDPLSNCTSTDRCWQLGRIDIYHALRHWFNFTPHDAQCEIIDGMKKYTTIAAGRRFGKTTLLAALMLHYALTKKESIQFCIAPSLEQAKLIFSEIRALATKSEMVRPLIATTKDFPFPELSLINGAIIYARSTGTNEGKYLRGHKAHRITLDESAQIKENIINTVIAPMLADYDGEMIQISTPLGRNHFFESYERGLKGAEDSASFHFTSFDNPHISHSYIKKQRARITDLQFRTEYLAEFVDDQVCVFKWSSIEDALEEYEESFTPDRTRSYYVGVDIAKMHDYTCIVVIDGTDSKHCKVVHTERFNNKPYSYVVERIYATSLQFNPVRILIDETGVGAGITEQIIAMTSVAEGFVFSMPSKIGLINTLKTGLEQRRIKLPMSNTTLSDELRFYQYETSEATGNIKMNAPSGKHDDFVIALALAYQKCSVVYGDVAAFVIEHATKPLNTDQESVLHVHGSERAEDSDPSKDSVVLI